MTDEFKRDELPFERSEELTAEIANAKQTDTLIAIMEREMLGATFRREAILKQMLVQAEKIGFTRAQELTEGYFKKPDNSVAVPRSKKKKR